MKKLDGDDAKVGEILFLSAAGGILCAYLIEQLDESDGWGLPDQEGRHLPRSTFVLWSTQLGFFSRELVSIRKSHILYMVANDMRWESSRRHAKGNKSGISH